MPLAFHWEIRTYGTDQPNLHHFWWKEQAQYAIFEMGLKMTDKAVAMIGGNFPLDENIIAGRFPRNAYQAGKIAAC